MSISQSNSVVRGRMEERWDGGGGDEKYMLYQGQYGENTQYLSDNNISKLNNRTQHYEQQQQAQLSYQSTRLSQYIELQLSQLQNTLHYIQKKHSLNQIKQSISHSYNIFCETEPIFKELKANSLYAQVKKLVNCYSIIYVVLMDKIQTGGKGEGGDVGNNSHSNDSNSGVNANINTNVKRESDTNIKTKTTIKAPISNDTTQTQKQQPQQQSSKVSKPRQMGGIHLYNQQYNRHIQSDQDRLKRKLKQQLQRKTHTQSNKKSQKQKLKEEILKQLNSSETDGSSVQGVDELQLFLNLNSNNVKGSNKYGSQLQLITFQDELQQIAAFFKQSQDEAMQFLNKSRDHYQALNFNSGFKQTLTIVKTQKDQQMNRFILKFRSMFEKMKQKAIQKEKQINLQIIELRKLQMKLSKPLTVDIPTQTIISYEQEILKLKRQIDQLTRNYSTLQQFHKVEHENESKEITFLQHKIAFNERQMAFVKKDIEEKNHFINFLNQKINQNIQTKLLKKFCNLYKNHTIRNSSKLKVELEQLEAKGSSKNLLKGGGSGDGGNNNHSMSNNNSNNNGIDIDSNQPSPTQSPQLTNQSSSVQQQQFQRQNKKSYTSPIQDFEKPNKKKRKPGISLFATPDKRLTTVIEKKTSLHFINQVVQQVQQENMVKEKSNNLLPDYEVSRNGELHSNNNVSGKSSQDSSRKTANDKQLQQNMEESEAGHNINQTVAKKRNEQKGKKMKKNTSTMKTTNNNNTKASQQQMKSPIAGNINEKTKKTTARINQQKKSFFASSQSGNSNSGNSNKMGLGKSNNSSRRESQQSTVARVNKQEEQSLGKNKIINVKQAMHRISIVKQEEEDIRNSDANNIKSNNNQQSMQQISSRANNLVYSIDNFDQQQQDNQQDQEQQQQQGDDEEYGQGDILWKQFQKEINKKRGQEEGDEQQQQKEGNNTGMNSGEGGSKKTLKKIITKQSTNVTSSNNYTKANNNNNKGMQSLNNSNNTSRMESSQQQKSNHPQSQSDNYLTKQQAEAKEMMLMPVDNSINQSQQLIEKLNQLSHLSGVNNQQKEQIINTYINSLYKSKKSKKSMLMSNMVQLSILVDKVPEDSAEDAMQQQSIPSKQQLSQNYNQVQIQNQHQNQRLKQQRPSLPLPSSNTKDYSQPMSFHTNNNNNMKKFSYGQRAQTKNNHSQLRQNESPTQSYNNKSKKYLTNNIVTQKEKNQRYQSTQHQFDQDTEQFMGKYNPQQYRLNSTAGDKKTHRKTIQTKTYSNQHQYQRIYGINSITMNKKQNNLSSTLLQYDEDKLEEYFEKNAIKIAIKSKNIEQFKAKIKKMHHAKCGENCKHLQRYIENFSKYRTNNREAMKIHVQDVNHTMVNEGSTPKINKENPLSFPSINQLNMTGFSSKGLTNGQKSSVKLLPKK